MLSAFTYFRRKIQRDYPTDLPASKIASISSVSRVTINKLLLKVRCRLAIICKAASPLSGEIKVDESYFSPCRLRGKRERGATVIFSILKRNGYVYSEIVPNAFKK